MLVEKPVWLKSDEKRIWVTTCRAVSFFVLFYGLERRAAREQNIWLGVSSTTSVTGEVGPLCALAGVPSIPSVLDIRRDKRCSPNQLVLFPGHTSTAEPNYTQPPHIVLRGIALSVSFISDLDQSVSDVSVL